MSLDSIVDSMSTYFGVQIPEFKSCESFGGKVGLEQMQDMSRKLPAAFVACMGTRDGEIVANTFQTRGLFYLSIAVDSKVGPQNDKLRLITALVGKALVKLAFAKDFGNAEIDSRPMKIASLNPYTQPLFQNNLAVWGITWEQQLRLTDPGTLPLDKFLVAEVDYQIVPSNPEIDAHDTIEPEQDP